MSEPFIVLVDSDRSYERILGPHLLASGFRFASAFSAKEGRSLTVLERPDVLVLDLDKNPRDSIRLLTDLKKHQPSLRVLWVSSHVGDSDIAKVRASGAHGLLWKGTDGPTTVRALRTLRAGGEFFEPDQPTRTSSGIRSLSMDERLSKLVRG